MAQSVLYNEDIGGFPELKRHSFLSFHVSQSAAKGGHKASKYIAGRLLDFPVILPFFMPPSAVFFLMKGVGAVFNYEVKLRTWRRAWEGNDVSMVWRAC